uniref:Piwi domain-containing protein n=1 Tax=Elaeophora elaphi TaxID=1147741 RepID=A0A0R3RXD5_9BILA
MEQSNSSIQSRNLGSENCHELLVLRLLADTPLYRSTYRISSLGSPCILPQLPPANVQENVFVKTNVYALEITDRIVYRYDVRIEACSGIPHTANAAKISLCRGKQDPHRAKKCMVLIEMALKKYRQLNEFAYAYDLSSTLFTNQPLDLKEVSEITVSSSNLKELQEMFGSNINISIKISECREFAHSFHTSDFNSSITPDLLAQDHSLRQFYEILTNQHGVRSGLYFSFGYGRLYQEKENDIKLKDEMRLSMGVDKSVRFIKGNQSTGLVPALVLDGLRLRLNDIKMFTANGLSMQPVRDLRCLNLNVSKQMPLMEAYKRLGIDIRPDLPAVVLKSHASKAFFPFEILYVAPNQKISDAKLRPNQKQTVMKNSVIAPNIRHKEIEKHMEALNLSGSKFNPVLAAFGVRISKNPMMVEANRRVPPQISYDLNYIINVTPNKASWNSGNNQFVTPAKVDNFHLFYDKDCNEDVMTNFFHSICNAAVKRGLNFNKKFKKEVCADELEANIKKVTMESSGVTKFVMYVDNKEYTHGLLKLYEALYQVVTQHVRYSTVTDKAHSLENIISKMNVKNFGHNYHIIPENYAIKRWLSSGNTLVIGYDVCHPEAQSAVERRLNVISTQPSVIGFSFNAAKEPETFIGDYAFHEPRQEQVTSSILESRMFHILKLFHKMRGKLPTLIVVTRDGVSEGQHKMVMIDELEAMRAGIRNYADFSKKTEYRPKMVLLIAVKRHNKRFFIEKERGQITCLFWEWQFWSKPCLFRVFLIPLLGVIQNCLPGTVIDHTVTRVDATEIFMQSHKVIKGTGKIPAYTLLMNEANVKMDELQAFINALCYNHQITTSAISLPEPIYQADEWAKRGRKNFQAMYKQKSDELPRKPNGKVDWNAVTNKLCYMDRKLELTRSNA